MTTRTAASRVRAGRVAVVGTDAHETNGKLVAAWRALGIDAVRIEPTEALERVERDDVVVGRIDVLPTVDGIEPGLLALRALEGRVARVLNRASALAAAHDKALTARLLGRAGVPQPGTALLLPGGSRPPIDPPLVLKPRLGSWGVDVRRCDTAAELEQGLVWLEDRPWFRRHGAVVQELVPPVGHDLRLLVADGRVVGATRRVPQSGEWRTNVALGAARVPVVPDAQAVALALAATTAVGADLLGVDLLPVGEGFVVLEVNGAADFDEQLDIAGVSVFAAAAEALELPRGLARGPAAPAARVIPPARALS